MRYRVLQRFITKNNVYEPEDVYQVDDVGRFTQRLLQYGFIEKEGDDMFERWEKEGIRSKLANVIIAPENYTDGEKEYFTWEEAMDLEKSLPDGWRLPTRKEWVLLCEEFGWNDNIKDLDGKVLAKKLKIQLNPGSSAYYWSRTAYDSALAYSFGFSSSNSRLYPADYSSRYHGVSVRLVKEVK